MVNLKLSKAIDTIYEFESYIRNVKCRKEFNLLSEWSFILLDFLDHQVRKQYRYAITLYLLRNKIFRPTMIPFYWLKVSHHLGMSSFAHLNTT